jgi:hypothetical protein
LLDEQLAAELLDHAAVAIVFYKSVVLLGGKRLKPVGVMSDSFFQCPHTHAGCHMIGDFPVDRCAIVNGVGQGFVRFLGEIFLHRLPVEDILAIVLRYFVFGSNGFHGLSVGCLLHSIKA